MKISDKIRTLKIDDIKPYKNNAKEHTSEQIDKIAASITRSSYLQPIVCDQDNVCVIGHGRLEALKKIGTKEVEVVCIDYLSEKEIKALRILDNKLNESSWIDDKLNVEIGELADLGLSEIEIESLTGVNIDDFDLNSEREDIEDDIPEVENVVIKTGDLIELGEHRVLCGDSTKIEDVEKLMNGQKADMCFTSPPYNANMCLKDGDIFNDTKAVKSYRKNNDNKNSNEYLIFVSKVLDNCFLYTKGFIFWNVNYNANSRNEYIKQIINKIDFLIEQVCWRKTSSVPFKGGLMREWEPIFIFTTDIKNKILLKDRVESNFWQINNSNIQLKVHKACFPVELVIRGLNIASVKGNICADFFLGSGSTLIACQKTNRKCYGMEINEYYCQVIIQRYCDYTQTDNIKINGKEYK